MKILVTGGTGFTCSHLVRHVLREGNQCVVLDNQSSPNPEKEKLLAELKGLGAEVIIGDVTNEADLRRAVPAEKKRREPVPVATAAAGKLGDWVTVVGALSEPDDLDGKGTAYRLTDDSGSIQVVFWNSTVPPDVQKKAAAAARASVNGKIKEYQGTRQVVPSKADGVEALERE